MQTAALLTQLLDRGDTVLVVHVDVHMLAIFLKELVQLCVVAQLDQLHQAVLMFVVAGLSPTVGGSNI